MGYSRLIPTMGLLGGGEVGAGEGRAGGGGPGGDDGAWEVDLEAAGGEQTVRDCYCEQVGGVLVYDCWGGGHCEAQGRHWCLDGGISDHFGAVVS